MFRDLRQGSQRVSLQPSFEHVRALKRIVTHRTIAAILKRTGQSRRTCVRLPKVLVVWLTIGMALFATDCYRQVYRWFVRFQPEGVPGRSTLCEARLRLGVAVLFHLVESVVCLLAGPATPGAFYNGLRLMAIDGFVLDLYDNPDIEHVFGRPRGSRADGAFPQARVLGLCEVATHVFWKYLIKPIRRQEITMAATLLRHLQSDMLLLWDRGFLSFKNVQCVLERKAHLLARIKKSHVFRPIENLPDGSFLAKIYPSSYFRTIDRGGVMVRIIRYTIDDPTRGKPGQTHLLLTTLLDAEQHPAERLIVLYHERWEEELAIDELKTHQREREVLRSQTPAGVVQEIHALLLGHFVIRSLMFEAAARKNLDPRRISFVASLKILRCRLPQTPRSEDGMARWYENLITEIATEVLPPRANRINPRVIKRKMSRWGKKRPHHYCTPQPDKPFVETVNVER